MHSRLGVEGRQTLGDRRNSGREYLQSSVDLAVVQYYRLLKTSCFEVLGFLVERMKRANQNRLPFHVKAPLVKTLLHPIRNMK